MTGVEVLREVAAHSPATMRILLTGYADMAASRAAATLPEPDFTRYTVPGTALVAKSIFRLLPTSPRDNCS